MRSSALLLTLAGGLAACDHGTDPTGTRGTPSSSLREFPSGLAVASPLAVQVEAGRRGGAGGDYTTHYAWATGRVDQLLAGVLEPSEAFDPGLFLTQSTNAPCFGPSMLYHDHPEGSDGPAFGNDPFPSLPSGDLGLWRETDPASGHACAAAELTAQMDGVSARSVMGLMGLASMLATATDAGVALPEAGSALDLLEPMNALGLPGSTFTAAEIALDAAGEVWSYELALTFAGGDSHDIVVSLQHAPGSDEGVYAGLLRWQVDDRFPGGHCPDQDVTYNGSLFYARSSSTSVLLNARDGMYCGHGTPAATTTDADVDATETWELVDPAEGFDGTSGWANGFSIVGAAFDPNTLAGGYTYAWQAGYGDSNARIFSVQISENEATQLVDGEAFYGFGDPIRTTDGTIDGFYCSWAAPGSTHTMQPYVQHQSVTFDPTTGHFEVPVGGSDITYAPTNDCTYEGEPAGFWYDRDLNRTEDEAAGDIEVSAKDLDLLAPTGKGTVPELIEARGFVQPPM